jgi:predicted RNase H-like nuclease (RuvC/YqgF family)
VKAPAVEPENATLAAVKALHEELKSLETRIAAQDARIAMLERTLESYTARNR